MHTLFCHYSVRQRAPTVRHHLSQSISNNSIDLRSCTKPCGFRQSNMNKYLQLISGQRIHAMIGNTYQSVLDLLSNTSFHAPIISAAFLLRSTDIFSSVVFLFPWSSSVQCWQLPIVQCKLRGRSVASFASANGCINCSNVCHRVCVCTRIAIS